MQMVAHDAYVEYDWNLRYWRFRRGSGWSDLYGIGSWDTFKEARHFMGVYWFALRKVGNRKWQLFSDYEGKLR